MPFQRGGYPKYNQSIPNDLFFFVPCSAAGKILRRELRDRAIEELKGRDPGDTTLECKL